MVNQKDLSISMPEGVSHVLDRLCGAGHDTWLVGGCIRDICLGRPPKDWDVATSALPQEVERLFPHTVPTGIRYGTVTVLAGGIKVDVTTFRSEGAYRDSRHPDTVSFVSDIDADLSRRDFTVNAMAYHPDRGWHDPHGGRADCESGVIRCVGEAGSRFAEDALRMLRAVRFAAQLGFALEAATLAAIQRNAPAIRNIAGERIREELTKILLAPHAGRGIWLLGESGLGSVILPQSAPAAFTWDADPWPPDITLRLAGWLCAAYSERCDVDEALNRMRFDNAIKGDVLFLWDARDTAPEPDPEWVRRRLYEWGRERVERYLDFQRAVGREVEAVRKTMAGVLERGECVSLNDLAVKGEDLLALGFTGPAVGVALERLMDVVLTAPGMNQKEKLIAVLRDHHS